MSALLVAAPRRKNRRLRCGAAGLLAAVLSVVAAAQGVSERLDQLGEQLSFSTADARGRAQLRGTLDLEGFYRSEPVSDSVFTRRSTLFNPRLTTYLDAQWGAQLYAFAQGRVDQGFDPTDQNPLKARLDELAFRLQPWRDRSFHVQVGQFATVVGNWAARHGSWENAFVTAPLPYDNLTGMWDISVAGSAATLLSWSHVEPASSGAAVAADQRLRLPIVWGPSYTSGAAVAGASGRFEYAIEIKNASLSSRPKTWGLFEADWSHPTVSTRLGWRSSPRWNFGVSASTGSFLLAAAEPSLPRGRGFGDYRQLVLAHDLAYAWRHLQVWAEVYAARFESPPIGNVDTYAYYVETRYKIRPRTSLALRWNQQRFDRIPTATGGTLPWGRQVWRIDGAVIHRLHPHHQLKLQLSLRHETPAPERLTHQVAVQSTLRF